MIGQLLDFYDERTRLDALAMELGSKPKSRSVTPSWLVMPKVAADAATQTEPGVWSPVGGIALGEPPSSDSDSGDEVSGMPIEQVRAAIDRYYELHPEMDVP